MSCQKHKELLERWWNDQLTEAERAGLAAQLAECEECRRELEGSRELWDLMGYMPVLEPSGEMQAQFNAMLDNYYKASEEGRRRPGAGGWAALRALFVSRTGVAVGFSLLMLLGGVGLGMALRRPGAGAGEVIGASAAGGGAVPAGKLIRDAGYVAVVRPKAAQTSEMKTGETPTSETPAKETPTGGTRTRETPTTEAKTVADRRPTAESRQLEALTAQVREMRELMMLSLLQNPAASERIKAVSYTSEIRHVNPNIANALLTTLNNDPNVNVRLTTLEALTHFAHDPVIREGLIQSILQQDSPLVQVALADVMLELQEKRAISPFKKLLQQKDLNATVRTKIEQTIVRLT